MADRVRVLYVIDSLVPGGAERSLATMAPHLIARGVDLDVAYLKDRLGATEHNHKVYRRTYRYPKPTDTPIEGRVSALEGSVSAA